MPRYEFSEGSSNKFWEITLDGASFTTTYGKIGTDGQSSLKEYASEEQAKKEYDKLVAEKVKKGYTLVSGGGSPAPAKPPATPPKAEAKAAPAKDKPVFDDEGEDDEAPEAKAKPAAAPSADKSSKGEAPGARYFELVDGSSSKFWEITLDGTSFTTRYGKIGTPGQESLKEYESPAKARVEYEKLVAEKVKKWYAEK